jgi:hypothetical protein
VAYVDDFQSLEKQGVRLNCRNCIHAQAKPEARAMNQLGFRNCKHLPSFAYVAGRNVCRIGKFEEKKK